MEGDENVRRLRSRIYLQCGFFVFVLVGISIAFAWFVETMYTDLDARMDTIEKSHDILENKLLSALKLFNYTVAKVEKDVEQQVQEVNDNVTSQNFLMAYQFAGIFAILGSLISFWHISRHARNLTEPIVQRKIIAIMWMIPIYSISSWLGLLFVEAYSYLSLLKDIYEAYVIYNFLSLLIAILGRGDRNVVIDLLSKHADLDRLKPPMQFPLRPKRKFPSSRHKAEAVLNQCQLFCMQFVFLRPITSSVTVFSDLLDENSWDPTMPQLYMTLITNVSIFYAFAGLMRFYQAMKNELIWCNPFSKFLCIKGIVFMTFWQSVAISFIAHAIYENNGDPNADEKATEWSKRAQSFVVCLEMFLFSIAHCFVFPTEEWEPGYRAKEEKKIKATFGDSLALKDFVTDVKTVMKSRNENKYSKINEKQLSPSNNDEDAQKSLVLDSPFDNQFEIDSEGDDGGGNESGIV